MTAHFTFTVSEAELALATHLRETSLAPSEIRVTVEPNSTAPAYVSPWNDSPAAPIDPVAAARSSERSAVIAEITRSIRDVAAAYNNAPFGSSNKIAAIKKLRTLVPMGLAEAKYLVEALF